MGRFQRPAFDQRGDCPGHAAGQQRRGHGGRHQWEFRAALCSRELRGDRHQKRLGRQSEHPGEPCQQFERKRQSLKSSRHHLPGRDRDRSRQWQTHRRIIHPGQHEFQPYFAGLHRHERELRSACHRRPMEGQNQRRRRPGHLRLCPPQRFSQYQHPERQPVQPQLPIS